MMLRLCGAYAILVLFWLLPVNFRTKDSISTPPIVQSTKTCRTASFTFSGSVCGSPTYFTNLSTNMNSCSWDFGDGSKSTATNPQHTYAAPGTYQVRLTVFGNDGTASFIGTVDVIMG